MRILHCGLLSCLNGSFATCKHGWVHGIRLHLKKGHVNWWGPWIKEDNTAFSIIQRKISAATATLGTGVGGGYFIDLKANQPFDRLNTSLCPFVDPHMPIYPWFCPLGLNEPHAGDAGRRYFTSFSSPPRDLQLPRIDFCRLAQKADRALLQRPKITHGRRTRSFFFPDG